MEVPNFSDNSWQVRRASKADIPALELLIPLSVRTLQRSHYSEEQMEAALGPVFGVDRQLIQDGTYFVACHRDAIIGCGGWSARRSLFGGDAARQGEDARLDPSVDPARIRAFFVHPDWTRRGIARAVLKSCEEAARAGGFRTAELVATLPGEPLYSAHGYREIQRYEVPLREGLSLPVVRMGKQL